MKYFRNLVSLDKIKAKVTKTDSGKIIVFTDFDGTITIKDIGDELFIEMGQFEPFHSDLINGKINIQEYWKSLCSSLGSKITKEIIERYALNQAIDPYFANFADFCSTSGINLVILSDGFDSYIKPIIKSISKNGIKIVSNKMIFQPNTAPVPIFPLSSESCHCLCASCKRNGMLNEADLESIFVYIGDGYSDFCAAEHADIIFAKDRLAAHCTKNKIPYHNFRNFDDILQKFKTITVKKRIKIRNQAYLNRTKAIIFE
ncbi:MAG: MtnX-like HAD-IB family phosphatase [Candidatus Kapabacteria bacterium]|nr:MtnX-like HAD-IB family phosphatase [Candidatus Kapabacteria bacterium]